MRKSSPIRQPDRNPVTLFNVGDTPQRNQRKLVDDYSRHSQEWASRAQGISTDGANSATFYTTAERSFKPSRRHLDPGGSFTFSESSKTKGSMDFFRDHPKRDPILQDDKQFETPPPRKYVKQDQQISASTARMNDRKCMLPSDAGVSRKGGIRPQQSVGALLEGDSNIDRRVCQTRGPGQYARPATAHRILSYACALPYREQKVSSKVTDDLPRSKVNTAFHDNRAAVAAFRARENHTQTKPNYYF